VALKIITARAGTVELDTLLRLKAISPEHPGHSHLPESLDHFHHTGINGTHTCLVFELLGENIGLFCRKLFSRNQLPPKLDKMVVRQLVSVLDFLHNVCGFAHTGNALQISSRMANML
jgi:serine/threonine-protein kinase SRPK3